MRSLVVTGLVLAVLSPAPAVAQESATPTAAMSPGPCSTPYGSPTARIGISDPSRTIVAGERVTVTATFTGGLQQGRVWIGGYQWLTPTRQGPLPLARDGNIVQHADYYSGEVPEGEAETHMWTLAPTGNTRVTWRHDMTHSNCGPAGHGGGTAGIIDVAPRLTIQAARNRVRDYTFSGTASRPGQLLSLYRTTATGSSVLTSQTRATAAGAWTIHRKFLGSGRFGFVLRSGRDMASAPGASRVRDTVIH